jgi:hypothetical protein
VSTPRKRNKSYRRIEVTGAQWLVTVHDKSISFRELGPKKSPTYTTSLIDLCEAASGQLALSFEGFPRQLRWTREGQPGRPLVEVLGGLPSAQDKSTCA